MNLLERKLLRSSRLPTLAPVAQRLLELLADDQVNLDHLARIIQVDPALSAKIIRWINSPLYGLSRQVTSLNDAVLYLGLTTVRSVALSFSLLSAFRTDKPGSVVLGRVWGTSLMNALAARRLANELGTWEPDEAFLTGLLADCCVLVLYRELPRYAQLFRAFCEGRRDLIDLEHDAIETDHARLAGLLLDSWNLPKVISTTISSHHDTEVARTNDPLGHRTRILHGAWQYARNLTVPGFASEVGELEQRISEMLGIPPTVARSIAVELPEEFRDTAGCFDIPTEETRDYEDLLSEANARLSRMAIEADRSARELAEALSAGRSAFGNLHESIPGSDELDRDTGLLTSQAFEQIIRVYHHRAREIRRPIGLLVLKLENFKQIVEHESYGVAVEHLRSIGQRTVELTRQSDQHARIGEDQIALLAPGCSSQNLRRAAERIHFGVQERALETPNGPMACRVCIGACVTHPYRDAVDPDTLIRFAVSAAERAETAAEPIVVVG